MEPPAPLSLEGRTVVITGASEGIGKAAALQLANAGAHVVMIGRNEAKTMAAANAIMTATGRRGVLWEIADLSNQRDVHELASRLRTRFTKIDILVNNAGALFHTRSETAEGLERTFALNHLAYFTLTLLLLDRLYAAAQPGCPARVVVVASRAHWRARLNLADLQLQRHYNGWRAYNRSKLANLLFARALALRLDDSRVIVQSLHPGLVASRFGNNNGRWGRIMRRIADTVSVSPAEGADTLVWLCSADEACTQPARYWVQRRPHTPSWSARNAVLAESLWKASASLAGLNADDIARRARD